MPVYEPWPVFNLNTSATTSNTILYTDFSTWSDNSTYQTGVAYPRPVVSSDPILQETAPKPEDSLTWLHRRVAEVTDMGRLN
jgi:hypothetical protein